MIAPEDIEALKQAKKRLEHPGLASRITSVIGMPIEKGLARLPSSWTRQIGTLTQAALMRATNAALYTLGDQPGRKPSNRWHQFGVAVSGGIGGFFGLGAIAVELPVSTTIMLRSVADIARSHGESINNEATRRACIEVFALGGKTTQDDSAESGYFAVRAALAQSVTEAGKYIAEKGVAEQGAPIMVKLIAKVAKRFGVQVTEKAAAQAIPAIGAAGGAAINTLFINHFQDMARGHFTVRRLERQYGADVVREAYEALEV
ncbi:MAG: EcsC family protein [Pusillimonas sp.]